MLNQRGALLALAALLWLVGCSSSALPAVNSTTPPPTMTLPAETLRAVPPTEPTIALPTPANEDKTPRLVPPAPGRTMTPGAGLVPADIGWEEAVTVIRRGQVKRVTQSHTLEVTLLLKDGRQLKVREPDIDAVFRVLDLCGAPCADVERITE